MPHRNSDGGHIGSLRNSPAFRASFPVLLVLSQIVGVTGVPVRIAGSPRLVNQLFVCHRVLCHNPVLFLKSSLNWLIFTQDVVFADVDMAASIVTGGMEMGLTYWATGEGECLLSAEHGGVWPVVKPKFVPQFVKVRVK